jgi:membrane protein
MLCFVMVIMAAVVALPIALNFVGLHPLTKILIHVARWPLLLVIVTVMLAFIYRYGPTRETARWQWVSWGSAIAAIAWLLVFTDLLLVRRPFRQLQQDLRVARRGDRTS